MKVVWTDPAEADRERIVFFIAQDNPLAAIEMDAFFTKVALSLAQFPMRGRRGREPLSRELIAHKNYILVYGIDEEAGIIYIKSLLHSSQQYPPE